MDEIQVSKAAIRQETQKTIDEMDPKARLEKTGVIEQRLFGFANFLEAKIVLFYLNKKYEIATRGMIRGSYKLGKILVLPGFNAADRAMTLFKVDDIDVNLKKGPRGVLEPDSKICKPVPIEYVDLAIIPGIVFDEKGGRIGTGEGYYDRMIPELSLTTRKVALALESQMVQQIPMEPHDKFVDIIITENRIIYKI